MPTGVIPWRPDPVAPRPNTLAFMPTIERDNRRWLMLLQTLRTCDFDELAGDGHGKVELRATGDRAAYTCRSARGPLPAGHTGRVCLMRVRSRTDKTELPVSFPARAGM
jgi:hypothetical protein